MSRAVIDQPGLKVILLILIASLFFGLSLRSQVTQPKVHRFVENYFSKLETANPNKQIKINFEKAEVLLTDWGMPTPYLRIVGVRITFQDHRCDENQVYIDTVHIPIEWSRLLKINSNSYPPIRIGLAEIRTANLQSCLVTKENSVKAIDETSSASLVVNENIIKDQQNIFIERLRLVDRNMYNYSLNLQSVKMKLGYTNQKVTSVEVKSQILALKDYLKNLYRLKSDLQLVYNVDRQQPSFIDIQGKIINRDFKVRADLNNQKEILFKVSGDALSTKTVLSALIQKPDSNFSVATGLSGLSFSFDLTGLYSLDSKTLSPLSVSNFKIFSDTTDIKVEDFQILDLRNGSVSPLKIVLSKLDLNSVVNSLKPTEIQNSFARYGVLTGTAVYQNQELKSTGQIEDLSLIFSNQGLRAYQNIDKIDYILHLNLSELNQLDQSEDSQTIQKLSLSNLVINENPVEGRSELVWHFNQDHSIKNLKVMAQFDHIILDDRVYELFTKESLRPPTDEVKHNRPEINFKFDHNYGVNVASATLSKLETEHYLLEKLAVQYRQDSYSQTKEEKYQFNLAGFTYRRNDDQEFLNQLMGKLQSAPDKLVFQNLKAEYKRDTAGQKMANGSFTYIDTNNQLLQGRFQVNPVALTNEDYRPMKIKMESFRKETPLSVFNVLYDERVGSYDIEKP